MKRLSQVNFFDSQVTWYMLSGCKGSNRRTIRQRRLFHCNWTKTGAECYTSFWSTSWMPSVFCLPIFKIFTTVRGMRANVRRSDKHASYLNREPSYLLSTTRILRKIHAWTRMAGPCRCQHSATDAVRDVVTFTTSRWGMFWWSRTSVWRVAWFFPSFKSMIVKCWRYSYN